jgi:hypothetical protein
MLLVEQTNLHRMRVIKLQNANNVFVIEKMFSITKKFKKYYLSVQWLKDH